MKKLFLITTILFIPVIINSCGEEEINSFWKNSPITIDGNETDWQGKTNYFTDYKAAIGVENDNDYLYLCLAVNDTGKVFQLFNRGFTVWINPDNGNEKLGILYPIGAINSGESMPFRNQSQGGRRERPDFEKIFNEKKMKQNEIRIINGDNFPLTSYYTNDTSVVHVDIGTQMGLLVYELKIPLSKNITSKHNFNLKPGDELNIGFESGDISRENFKSSGFQMGNRNGNMPPEGGMEGRGGRMPRGGGKRGQRQHTLEKIDFEIAVKLAVPD